MAQAGPLYSTDQESLPVARQGWQALQQLASLPMEKGLSFRTLGDLLAFAEAVVSSRLCPTQYIGRPLDAAIAIAYGRQVGLSPFGSLLWIAVVNGRPSIYGDAALAVVRQSPLWVEEAFKEEWIEQDGKIVGARCTVQRRGGQPITRQFTLEDARRAGLLDREKPTAWNTYPARMLQMRARTWALRDAFGDILCGLAIAEEASDLPPEEVIDVPTNVPPHIRRTKELIERIKGEQSAGDTENEA